MQDFVHGYEIEAVLQERGNAKVFLIQEDHEFIVMKTIVAETEKDREQFIREITCLQRLNHPNVISFKKEFDCPRAFTMPYIEGLLLRYVIDGGGLSRELITQITTKLLQAVEYVHQQGFLHCDLKPENVIIQENGEPILFDFGLNQSINETIDLVLGSTNYMPKEVQEGEGWSTAGEVYALGRIFNELVEQSSEQEELASMQEIMSACLKRKEDRPANCTVLLQQLQNLPHCNELVVKKKTIPERKSNKTMWLWFGVLLLIIIACGIVL